MELYIHIPFCVRKCKYCDFLSFGGYGCDADEKHHSLSDAYVKEICKELDGLRKKLTGKEISIDTVFIGGGTPSVLDGKQTETLFAAVGDLLKNTGKVSSCAEDPEFTVECNPGTITEEKLLIYRKYGVNRLSMGLQSADDNVLETLGRIHDYACFEENFLLARRLGFENINVDLISAVPGQDMKALEETLRKTAGLSPEHISVYSLILEEGTPLYEMYMADPASLKLPDEETERRMYRETGRILSEYGYKRYEISNYAKEGRKCRHNIGYWTGKEYLGIGPGAASYLSDKNIYLINIEEINKEDIENDEPKMYRIKNSTDLYSYTGQDSNGPAEAPEANVEEILSKEDLMAEFCILGLRLTEGISKTEFERRFGLNIYDRFKNVIEKYVKNGLLEDKDDRIRFTERGLDLSNSVLCEFL